MLAATLLSLGVVFLAELGDRSQLLTMTYALRYRWWVVLTGVAIASVTGARRLGRDRPLPGRHAAGPPDGFRLGYRLPDFCRVGLAGRRRQ